MCASLPGKCLRLLHQRGTILSLFATGYISLRIAWVDSKSLDPRDLREAIRLLQPNLPNLLGPNYTPFVTELDKLIQNGSNDELLSLFARFPNTYITLHNFLCYLLAGGDLFGKSKSFPPSIQYICPVGDHRVDLNKAPRRDVRGFPLCPVHNQPMTKST